jgi:hypothetical protein
MLNDNYNQENIEDKYDLKQELFKYLFFWRWFVFSIILCLIISFFYLRYAHTYFKIGTIIVFKILLHFKHFAYDDDGDSIKMNFFNKNVVFFSP